MVEVRRVVLYWDEHKMEVLVIDRDKARLIEFDWTPGSNMPTNWLSQVEAECTIQRDHEKRKAEGRVIL